MQSMTTDRAWKLAGQVADVVAQGGPYTDDQLRKRIRSPVLELRLCVDWRILPEDQAEDKKEVAEFFEGQIALSL